MAEPLCQVHQRIIFVIFNQNNHTIEWNFVLFSFYMKQSDHNPFKRKLYTVWKGYISNNTVKQSSDSLFCEAELITTANTAFSAHSVSRSWARGSGDYMLFKRMERNAVGLGFLPYCIHLFYITVLFLFLYSFIHKHL